ncbi:MAG: SulP family inorganic anion transporter [Actinomycetota bacterium]
MNVAQEAAAESRRVPQPAGVLLPGTRARLVTEIFAGVTLAALSLPLNIGYAEAAGLPVIVGINAAILPVIAFALFSGSRHLITGPDATIAALLAGVLPSVAASSGAMPEELALGLAMLTGLVLIVLWLVRAGSLVRFISKSVLVGFLAGLGIEILTSQVEKIMNVKVDTGEWLTDVGEMIKSIPDASVASIVVGVSTIVILRLTKRFTPKLPGPLIALVIVGGAVYMLDPGGVSVLGEIPSGLPDLSFPTLDFWTWLDLLGTAVAIAVLTIAEGLLVASAAARRHDDALDANGELAAMGIANLVGAVTSGMPIGASASRSAATEAAGSRSQMPGLVSALIVMLVALYFTDLVAEIPSAALAGLVANAVVSVIDVRAFRMFARVRRSEFFIAIGCTAGVLVLGPVGGLVLAMLATMVDMVRRIAGSPWVTLEPPEGDWEMERFAAVADPDTPPTELEGVSFVRLTGPLFFANADTLRERIEIAAAGTIDWVLLDFESVTDLDPTASEALADSVSALHENGKVVGITRASVPVQGLLELYGITETIGSDHIYLSNRTALAAYLEQDRGLPGSMS